ncbi:hypothetical protein C1645_811174 [Glomus cerebriforme]|uniref:Uncharacterized protein n=1 Tax=Glomus cerebriforme TaxID=658196 RepID=A0A397TXQ2_9GLOM|nr:hypothetical protein C1645_811174 [Glomus cerebriforme]
MFFGNKFLSLLSILVIFATLAIPFPLDKRLSTTVIAVTAPGPGPWAIGSKQNASWFCMTCRAKDNVNIEIIKNGRTVVFKTTGENSNVGSKDFVIDPVWAIPGNLYNVRVSLQKKPKVFGISLKPFTVFQTRMNLPIHF